MKKNGNYGILFDGVRMYASHLNGAKKSANEMKKMQTYTRNKNKRMKRNELANVIYRFHLMRSFAVISKIKISRLQKNMLMKN